MAHLLFQKLNTTNILFRLPISKQLNNNFSNLLWHRPYGKEADANCNLNHKRFLLSVNLRTNDIELIQPHIHWYYGEKSQNRSVFSEQTFEIEHQYATNQSYILENNDDEIPF